MSERRDLVAELAAKQAVTEQLHAYCRGLDRMDRALADRVWHPGGTADYGPGYRGSASGFLDFVWEFHAGYDCHSHIVSNILIDVDSASATAASESYVAVWLRTAAVDGLVTDQFHRGRYLDRWSSREGLWAIEHRIYVGDLLHEAQHTASPVSEYSAPSGR
ncbi:nuclear transport factor 2 family protein [Nocardia sp. KC 131]|uniref:nuclear transport factor 2 family protein n=1 Tax=Nocardia arseniciresistens TaxID=3392119 RepID=UPI00398F0293